MTTAPERLDDHPVQGGPATLGSTLAAGLSLIVCCKACRHQVEPDVAKATVVGLRQGSGIGLTEGIAAGISAAGHPGIGTGIEATKPLSRFFGSPDRAVQNYLLRLREAVDVLLIWRAVLGRQPYLSEPAPAVRSMHSPGRT